MHTSHTASLLSSLYIAFVIFAGDDDPYPLGHKTGDMLDCSMTNVEEVYSLASMRLKERLEMGAMLSLIPLFSLTPRMLVSTLFSKENLNLVLM